MTGRGSNTAKGHSLLVRKLNYGTFAIKIERILELLLALICALDKAIKTFCPAKGAIRIPKGDPRPLRLSKRHCIRRR